MNDELDALFGDGSKPPRPSFTERLARPGQAVRPVITDDGLEVGGYKAYEMSPTTTVTAVCSVRSWMPGTDVPVRELFHYRYLHGVTAVADTLLTIKLIGGIILVEGRGLTGLDEKLMRGTVTFIQQYHSGVWTKPSEDGPFIERIELVRPEVGKQGD